MLNQDEVWSVKEAMMTYGGSFVKALGKALEVADSDNQARIKEAFPKYWKQYVEMGKRR